MQKWLLIIFLLLFIGPLTQIFNPKIKLSEDWATADRSTSNLAPNPATTTEAIVQVYAARAFNWRGLLSLHTWIAIKPKNASQYTTYQVIGWRLWQKLPVLEIQNDIPDRKWFNQTPWIIKDLRGKAAETAIPEIQAAAAAYPYKNDYHLWPGPNSNTFTAYVALHSPALNLAVPALAVGKDYLGLTKFFAAAPSHTGYQFSLWGIFGILIAKEEGLEINIFGLVYGINPWKPSITFPGYGELLFRF